MPFRSSLSKNTVISRAAVVARCSVATVMLTLASGPVAADGPRDSRVQQAQEATLTTPVPAPISDAVLPQAVTRFYTDHAGTPVWTDRRFDALLVQLAGLADDGLNPEDYGLGALQAYRQADSDPVRASEREPLATRAYLQALLHLWHGKVDPRRLDPNWNFAERPLDPLRGLALARQAVEGDILDQIFMQARPAFPQYRMLRAELARLRGLAAAGGWPTLEPGQTLRPGLKDARIPRLRQRLRVDGLLAPGADSESTRYDEGLVAAVRRFQQEAYLPADGVLGPGTLAALNVPVAARIDQVRANLERLRWFGQAINGDAVVVDIAGYRAYYWHDGQARWQTRVQVGKAYRATPVLQSTINRITLNPTWTVPPTIFEQDSLPAIRRGLDYLSRNRIRVLDAAGRELDPATVNWAKPGRVMLRQDPGPGNSLGRLVIRFPNGHDVYLHDTPHRELFDRHQRAFSSGCIRVERIDELAVLLLAGDGWDSTRLEQALADGQTREVALSTPVPVFIAYWTVDVGPDGHVSFKPDVYARDVPVVQALNERAGPPSSVQ